MVLIKILKRKDASSLIVAIIIAGIISGLLTMTLIQPSAELVGGQYQGQAGLDLKSQLLQPVVFAVFQLLALEILAWLVIGIASLSKKKK